MGILYRVEYGKKVWLKDKETKKDRRKSVIIEVEANQEIYPGESHDIKHKEKEVLKCYSRQSDNCRCQLQFELHISEIFILERAFGRAKNPHSH
jgi:hypothetical protein